MTKELSRFSQIIAEEVNHKNACPTCGTIMVPAEFPRSIDMQYCGTCDSFRPKGNTDGNPATKKDPSL